MDISAQLRLAPSEMHNIGDSSVGAHTLPHSVWSLKSPLSEQHEIDDHLAWFAEVLRQRLPELRSLVENEDVSFFCSYHLLDGDYGGFTLSPQAFAIALELGIRIECHIMCLTRGSGEDEDEVLDRIASPTP